jgi:hypothetical protein
LESHQGLKRELKGLIYPQHLVEPYYIEGGFEGIAGSAEKWFRNNTIRALFEMLLWLTL